MKKFLFSSAYKNICWIGFDLDGTIYDEFEFITQAYRHISNTLVPVCDVEQIITFMMEQWCEKGSAYPYIFKETQTHFKLHVDFEKKALEIFRNIIPVLTLSARMYYALRKIQADKKKMFLLTDGHQKLQTHKILALHITHFFDQISIAETHQKPDPYYGEKLVREYHLDPTTVAYIGDKNIDNEFALHNNFLFVKAIDLI